MKKIYFSKLVVLLALLAGWNVSSFAQTTTFSYTGGQQTYLVGPGVTNLGIDAIGGVGGYPYWQCSNSVAYGLGGRVQCTLAVTPGQTLYIYVGGAGGSETCSNCTAQTGGFNGGVSSGSCAGGSGGGTDIRLAAGTISGSPAQVLPYTSTNRVVVAGGGGGGADYYGTGGAGGGLTGGTGYVYPTYGGTGGSGGTQVGPGPVGGAGSLGVGAPRGSYCGGGGGYWGGNSGSGTSGGSGGGSSYTDPTLCSSVIHTQGYSGATGNGSVSITVLCSIPFNGPISGPSLACVSVPTSYTTTSTPGGAWFSSNTAVATINPTSGVVTGVSAGTTTISYSYVVSCGFANPSKLITVNNLPAAISGTINSCVGLTNTLSDATPGGKWSSGTTTVATIGATTGIVNGVASGSSIITYQVTATGCMAMQTQTVNPLPVIYTTSIPAGTNIFCSGAPGAHVLLSGTDPGVNYQLYNVGLTLGGAIAGTGSPLDFGLKTLAGAYTVKATNATNGCPVNMVGSPSMTVNPLPNPYTVTVSGGGSFCATGTGLDIQLSNSDAGISYQLFYGALQVGPTLTGTGSALDFGLYTGAGTYTIVGTNTITTCSGPMSNSVSISINPLPNSYTVSVTNGGSFCAGGAGVHVLLNSSDLGINYELFAGGITTGIVKSGTGSGLDFGLVFTAGTYTVVAKNAVTSCTKNMSGSVLVSINSVPAPYPVTGGGSYCPGGVGVHDSLSFSSLGILYKLYKSGTLVDSLSGTGGALDFGLKTAPGTYTITGTNTYTGCVGNMSGSATIAVSPLPTPYLMTITGPASYCAGGSGSLVGLTGSDAGTTYQLFNGITPVGSATGTGSSFNFGFEPNGTYTAVATSSLTGCSNNMSGSVTVTKNAAPTAYAVLTTAPGGNYCTGSTGIDIKLSASDIGVNYQLYQNGVAVTGPLSNLPGTNLSLFFGMRTAGTYTIIGTNTGTGCTNAMSNSVLATSNPLPTAFTVIGGGSYCVGGLGQSVGLSFSEPGVNYQLYLNGAVLTGVSPLAGSGGMLDFGLQTGIGNYTVAATNVATGCTNNMTGSVSVNTTPLPTVYTMTGGGNYCAGTTGVHVGLSASNIGINYQLYNGTLPVGGTTHGSGLALDFGLQTVAGTYTVIAANAVTSCGINMSGSETINVNPLPNAYSVTGGGNYCAGGAGMDVGLNMSDININYQLLNGTTKVGSAVAGTGSALDFGIKAAAGTYTVMATDAVSGCTAVMSGSAVINAYPLPLVYTVSGGGSYCSGGSGEHIFLSGSNVGTGYQLYNSGVITGTPVTGTGIALDFGAQTAGGSYTVVAVNTTTGCSMNMLSSAMVSINPLPTADSVLGGGSYCAGGTGVNIRLKNSDLGITYQLYLGSTAVGFPAWGSGSSLDLGVQTAAGTYTVQAVNAATGCTSNMLSNAIVNIIPIVIPSVSVSEIVIKGITRFTVCEGAADSFVAIPVNGGLTPVYAWFVNGTLVTGMDSFYSYIPAKTGDIVKVIMTSSAQCALPSAVSNSVVMTVNPTGNPSVSISEDPGATVCKGTKVTFGAVSPAFGGSAPTYSWSVGGTVKGAGLTYSYVPVNNDMVSVTMTSNDPCALLPSGGNSVTMVVQPPLAPVFSITATPSGALVIGQPVTLKVVISSNGGPAPTFQWVLNGTPLLGETANTLKTSNLFNKDSVTCIVTGSGDCGGLPTSHSVIMNIHSLGVDQAGKGSDIRVMPNPNNGTFIIKGTIGTGIDEEVSLEISNMLGQVVYSNKVMARDGKLNEQVQMSNGLASGMYILNVRSANEHNVFHFVVE